MFYGAGAMAGPVIGGFLYELGGYGLPFWVVGSLLLSCTAIMAVLLPNPTGNGLWLIIFSQVLVGLVLGAVIISPITFAYSGASGVMPDAIKTAQNGRCTIIIITIVVVIIIITIVVIIIMPNDIKWTLIP
nr:hypothetical protein BaRGS_027025 [Batillaria attramentaria]